MHHAYALEPQHIGDLMRIGEHGCRAVRNDRARKFGRGQHAAFNVHMRIAEPGDHEPPVCLYDFCLFANAVACVRADVGYAAFADGDVMICQNLAGVNIHPLAFTNDKVCCLATGGNSDEFWGAFGPGF